MKGISKLELFFDKYPITVVWFPFCILAQVPWLLSVFVKYDKFMK